MGKKVKRPSETQARLLQRIAQSYMMVTQIPGEPDSYHFPNGEPINGNAAQALIRNRWVKGNLDSMFDSKPQRYDALKP